MVGWEVAGGVMQKKGKKKRGDLKFDSWRRGLPGHRTDFFWPLCPLSLSTTPGLQTPALSLAGSRREGWALLSPVLPARCRGELRVRKSGDAPSDDVVPFCAVMAFFESQMGISLCHPRLKLTYTVGVPVIQDIESLDASTTRVSMCQRPPEPPRSPPRLDSRPILDPHGHRVTRLLDAEISVHSPLTMHTLCK